MKQGYVYVSLVKVIVEGPAGVGKTCLIYLLLSKCPQGKRHSTGCAERAIRVIRIAVGKEGGEWSEISKNEFQKIIAEAVPVLCKELDMKGKGIEALDELLSSLEGEGKEGLGREGGKSVPSVEGMALGREKVGGGGERFAGLGKRKRDVSVNEEGESTGTENDKVVIERVIEKLTQLVTVGESSNRLLDMELIYITDSGGQQAYWDLKPIFSQDTSATLFVHRLCEKLDEYPLNDLYYNGQQVGPSQRATLTTGEAFKTMLRGLFNSGNRSKVIAIGTHRDLVDNCEETPEEKDERIAEIASPHFTNEIVYCNEEMKQIVFRLNTKNPSDDDKKVAAKIRASIEKSATQHKIPIWWFILQLILEALAEKLGRDVLSKNECVRVSDALGFGSGELDAALDFFDKLNIFLYKNDILPEVVFTNAQVPLDKLSVLVEKKYHLQAVQADPRKANDLAMTGNWQRFRDNGILTLNILKEFEAHYVDGIFTANDFLFLLEKLLIVSQLHDSEYFFPAILNMTTEAQINEYLTSSRATNTVALVVQFPTGWAPPGVYCCSVCHLQSEAHWELEVAHKPHTTAQRRGTPHTQSQLPPISRNCITFTKKGRPGSVTFIDNFSFFTVSVNVDTSKMRQENLIKHFQAIKSDMISAVEAGLKNTHHTDLESLPVTALLCPHQNKSCSTELHLAHISDNGEQWICSKNSDVFDNLTPQQTLWLTGSGKFQQLLSV